MMNNLGETDIGVSLPGLGDGKIKRITSFPTRIQKDEILIDKLNLKNSIKYVVFTTNENNELVCKIVESISKKD